MSADEVPQDLEEDESAAAPNPSFTRARAVHLLTLAAAGVFLLAEASSHWFYLDEWDYLANRGIRLGGRHGVFFPHNEHWTTIPIVIWRAIFDVVGVRDYWLYAVPLVVAHLAVAYLLWRLMVRHSVDPWTATLLVAAFAVLGVGSQELLRAFQIGFVGSLLFGLLAVESVENDRLVLPAVWGVLAIMCSDIGVPMVVGAALVALARRKPRIAALAAVPPAFVFLVWYEVIGDKGTNAGTFLSSLSLGGLVSYIWTGLTASMGGFVDATHYVGALLISVLAGAAVVRRNLPAALAATTLALFAFVGFGRQQLGAAESTSSRYSYLAIALLLPLIGQLVTTLMRNPELRPFVVSGLVLLVGANVVLLHADRGYTSLAQVEHTQMDAAALLVSRGGKFAGEYSAGSGCTFAACVAEDAPRLTTLAGWVRRGQYPVPATLPEGVLRAERTVLGVFTSPERRYAGNPIISIRRGTRCATVHTKRPVVVRISSAASLRLSGVRPMAPTIMTVLFPATRSAPATSVIVPVSSVDRWLNLPPAPYRAAFITSFAPVRACEGSNVATQ